MARFYDWWDFTWDPVSGCWHISPGCKFCYAAIRAATLHQAAGADRRIDLLYDGITKRVDGRPAFNGKVRALKLGDRGWTEPFDMKNARPLLGPGKPLLIFVGNMSDLFYEQRPTDVIDRALGILVASDQIGLVLTKRPAVMAEYFSALPARSLAKFQKHLWLGFSAENQAWFDLRWAAMRPLAEAGWTVFVSIAPMLGQVVLPPDFLALGDRAWVIVSGEAGRPQRLPQYGPGVGARDTAAMPSRKGPVLFQAGRKAPADPTRPVERARIPPGVEAMIVNLRSTNGSGKSTVIRNIMARGQPRPIFGIFGMRRPETYRLALPDVSRPVYVIGPYLTNCGGCDHIQPYDLILTLLDEYAPQGHVVFEGSLISDHHGRIGEWLTRRGRESVVAFLDTPLEECLRRLRARTPDAGEKHVATRFNRIHKMRERFINERKVTVLDISSENGADAIMSLLRGNLAAPATTTAMPVGAPASPRTTMMNIEQFGQALIETGDLDPVYCAIHGAKLPADQLARLLMGYWCFYNLGVAAWLSEQDDFWDACRIAAVNQTLSPIGGRWPRGAERRHFRGEKCVQAIDALATKSPEALMAALARLRSAQEVIAAVSRWPQFGPWIGFKAADMLERCAGFQIKFSSDICLLYKGPRSALLARAPDEPDRELARLMQYFGQFPAPPAYDRSCGYQEIETVLCKHAAYLRGTYAIGKDTAELQRALTGWGDTANRLRAHLPMEAAKAAA